MYAKYLKRFFDFIVSLCALIVLSPILLILVIVGSVAMKGNPFFIQPRPGRIDPKTGKEKIFKLIKLRTMDNRCDEQGKLLSDEERLCAYGRFLRATSLDEIFSLWNILKGDISIVGPRPQLVRDMVFMTSEQRRRHTVRPGLTGLAQVNGRNNMLWEKKFEYDLIYISDISLLGDIRIILKTVVKVLQRDGISAEGMATAMDYGDYLLEKGEIDSAYYEEKQEEARKLLRV